MIKKIGVLGGSFDPVHYGHLILAEQVRSAAGLDAVMLIPANISPFKLESEPASGEDRFEMVKLA
ncbi:MAG: adenylyltransferase/cytidyltransferase family protein, partial [Firmicutes bacterium]|nr:adenylyltransferase/cytidyltransferase family protein [Bacillota bacterium]